MKPTLTISEKIIKIIGYIIVIFSIVLIAITISNYVALRNSSEISTIIDLVKWKEITISSAYLYCLLLLLGIGLVKRNFLAWIIPQILLLICLVPFWWWVMKSRLIPVELIYLILGSVFSVFSIFIFRYFIVGKPKTFFQIKKSRIKYYYLIIVSLSGMFWSITPFIW